MNDNIQSKKPKFMRAREVADSFFDGKINYAKVLKLTKEGKIPSMKIGKVYYYTQEQLIEWANRNLGTPAWNKVK